MFRYMFPGAQWSYSKKTADKASGIRTNLLRRAIYALLQYKQLSNFIVHNASWQSRGSFSVTCIASRLDCALIRLSQTYCKCYASIHDWSVWVSWPAYFSSKFYSKFDFVRYSIRKTCGRLRIDPPARPTLRLQSSLLILLLCKRVCWNSRHYYNTQPNQERYELPQSSRK